MERPSTDELHGTGQRVVHFRAHVHPPKHGIVGASSLAEHVYNNDLVGIHQHITYVFGKAVALGYAAKYNHNNYVGCAPIMDKTRSGVRL